MLGHGYTLKDERRPEKGGDDDVPERESDEPLIDTVFTYSHVELLRQKIVRTHTVPQQIVDTLAGNWQVVTGSGH